MNEMQAIQQGFAAFNQGDYASAKRVLNGLRHPQALHISGLAEKNLGNYGKAIALLQKAAKADARNHEIPSNLGLVFRLMGRLVEAERAFLKSITLKADFTPAILNLGKTLSDLGQAGDAVDVLAPLAGQQPGNAAILCALGQAQLKLEDWSSAEAAFNLALAANPQHMPSHLGHASARLELGHAEEAETELEAMLVAGIDAGPVRFVLGRARLQLSKSDAGLADLQAAHQSDPTPLTLKTLAGTLWMRGETDAFDKLLSEAANAPELALTGVDLRRESGDDEAALAALAALPADIAETREAQLLHALILQDLDRPSDALPLARKAYAGREGNLSARACVVVPLLMLGEADDALELIMPARAENPDDQGWIAYEATALRLKGDPAYGQIMDVEAHVRPYELPVPEGFSSIEDFNAAFLEALDRQSIFKTHPLDQSLREGVQTPRGLMDIPDPVIEAYIKALDAPIRQYMADIGTAPDHLLTARNTGNYKMTGCWSVRLGAGGWHINHVHPEGWISSAYYAAVPEETPDVEDKAGWIKFGEPPFRTVPPTPPEKWICPKAGLLVLFPSFMWHGTHPIHDGATRVTAPFDLVPA